MASPKLKFIGTASWTVAKIAAESFPLEGSHLERYSKVLRGVEINSSFYKHHQAKTYARWAESVPANFQFSIKLHQSITHDLELKTTQTALKEILLPISELKKKWGVLLVQLPKSVEYKPKVFEKFLAQVREITNVKIALEARNPSFEDASVLPILKKYKASQVIADPVAITPSTAATQAGGFRYLRLHGSPEIYKSNYTPAQIKSYAEVINASRTTDWCIFDNTTFGYATTNALELSQLLDQ